MFNLNKNYAEFQERESKRSFSQILKITLTSLIAALTCTGIICAATTVGNNITTGGTLTVTGANTLYGATFIGGAITATSTLTVSGLTTLENASTTVLSVSGNSYLATTTMSGNLILQNLTTFPVSPSAGQMFYSAASNTPHWYDGANSRWLGSDPSEDASYIVYQVGSIWYAKNGITGSLDYSGAAAHTVINNALANTPNTTVSESGLVVDDGDGTQTVFNISVPGVIAGTLQITHTYGSTYTNGLDVDAGDGTGSCATTAPTDNIASCTVDYLAGLVTVTFTNPPDNSTNITVAYDHGRTWQEKVVVRGNVSLTGQILMTSYTHLEIQGTLKDGGISSGGAIGIITNLDRTNGNRNITIEGGAIHADYTNSANGQKGILIQNADNVEIRNVYVQDTYGAGIEVDNVQNFVMENNYITHAGDDGLSVINDSLYGRVNKNLIEDNQGRYGGGSGIEIEDGSAFITVSNNIIKNITATGSGNDGNGILVVIDNGSSYNPPHDITITGNVITNVKYRGIMTYSGIADGSDASNYIYNIIISDNIIDSAQEQGLYLFQTKNITVNGNTVTNGQVSGMYLTRAYYTQIINNTFVNNALADTSDDWNIYIHNPSGITGLLFNSNTYIVNNTFIDENDYTRGVGLGSADTVIMKNNNVSGLSTVLKFYGINGDLSSNIVEGNLGYPRGIQTIRREYTATEVKAMATPITLIPAQGTYAFIELVSVSIFLNKGTQYDAPNVADDIAIEYADGEDIVVVESTGFIDSATDEVRLAAKTDFIYPTMTDDLDGRTNEAIQVHNAGVNWTTGTGSLVITATYIVHQFDY